MQRRKIVNDTLFKIKTKRGAIILPAMGDDSLKPGHAFLHMHWGSAYMAGDGINALANPVRDPISHQPELKHSAAGLEVFKHAWTATAWVRGDPAHWRPRLVHWLKRFPYAVLVSSALGGRSVRLRLAGPDVISAAQLEQLATDLELDQAELSFDDPARGIMRRLRRHEGKLDAWLLAGDTRAANALLLWADTGAAPRHASRSEEHTSELQS